MNIVPAILVKDYTDMLNQLNLVKGLATSVQVDLCDGVFGKVKTFLPEEKLYFPPEFEYEFDVMMFAWQDYIPVCLDLGAKKVVAHIDHFTENDNQKLLEIMSGSNVSLGLCVGNDFDTGLFLRQIEFFRDNYLDIFIQVMGIRNIGAQGEDFDEECLNRIKIIKQNFPNIFVQVDGSVNDRTIKKIKEAGADGVVVGSYLFRSDDIKKHLEVLRNI